ncbi:MAG: glucosamine-6-phosphate deaminase [Bacilli bacterium]|jgi:glucosamine-6-phosphate deaminase
MEIIIKNQTKDIAIEVAKHIIEIVEQNPKSVLGLATGSTPLDIYRNISKLASVLKVSFANVTTFNLDEYLGPVAVEQSYRYFMHENFFKFLDVDLINTKFPNEELLEKYDDEIDKAGGIDIQLLGIGSNGHIAFNEPFTPFDSKTHIVKLDDKTRNDNARFFSNIDEVPTHAITMGISTIMKAKEIILVILGDSKVSALKQLLCLEPDESFPASVLSKHPNIKVYTTMDLFKKAFC